MLRGEEGFTMIELILVLVMMTMVMGIGIEAHQSAERIKLAISAGQIQTLINKAHCRSYNEQNRHTITFKPETKECHYIKNTYVIEKVKLPRGIALEGITFLQNSFYFDEKLGPSAGGTIKLNSKSHTIKITVLPVTGRVKIYPLSIKKGG